jgi:hypothetical protein
VRTIDSRAVRFWLVLVLGGVAVALLPWSAYLSATLPGKHVARHWDLAWAGLDVMEAVALVATLFALVRRSPFLEMFAGIAGTLLVVDAWFDLATAHPGRDLDWALTFAVLGELPLAALCFWIAFEAVPLSDGRRRVSGAAPPPRARPDRPEAGTGPARTGGSGAPSAGRTSR